MAERRYNIRLETDVHTKLKIMAAREQTTLGRAIEALINFSESPKYLDDPVFNDKFHGLLDQAFADAKSESGWSGEDGFDFKAKAQEIKRKDEE